MAVGDDEKKELKNIILETLTEHEAARESARAEAEAKNKAKEGEGKPNDGDGGDPPKRSFAQRLLG